MKNFGDWITERRKKLGMRSQTELAMRMSQSLSTVYTIEKTGDVSSRERVTQQQLARALRVSLEDLERLEKGEIADAPILPSEVVDIASAVAAAIEETGMEPNEWIERLPQWLAMQSPGFREYVVNAVAQTPLQRIVTPSDSQRGYRTAAKDEPATVAKPVAAVKKKTGR